MNRATTVRAIDAAEVSQDIAPSTAAGSNPHVSVLSSWKEIASYLGKGVRTVQRWEIELGLPVHRPVPGSRRIVITTKEELAAWLVQQQTRAQQTKQPIPRNEFRRMKALVHDT